MRSGLKAKHVFEVQYSSKPHILTEKNTQCCWFGSIVCINSSLRYILMQGKLFGKTGFFPEAFVEIVSIYVHMPGPGVAGSGGGYDGQART